MSILKRPYEISLWQDSVGSTGLVETKVAVLGSDRMTHCGRATNPVLVSNINGTHKFSFTMYYRYVDVETGEWVDNPLVKHILNESKIKLNYDGTWYDFVVKSITENSSDYTYKYELTDLFINELSRTGFDLEFTQENMGTIQELGAKALEGSGWTVDTDSDVVSQEQVEPLFQTSFNKTVTAHELVKDATGAISESSTVTTFHSGDIIYIFYSCCANKTPALQFLWLDGEEGQTDSKRVLLNAKQYILVGDETYSTIETNYNVYRPNDTNALVLSSSYRGARYVRSQIVKYDDKIKKHLYKYSKDGAEWWAFTETDYPEPNIVQNYISNHTNFTTANGWRPGEIKTDSSITADSNKLGSVEASTEPSIQARLNNNQPLPSGSVISVLNCALPAKTTTITPAIINTGFMDSRASIGSINKGDRFVCLIQIQGNFPTGLQVRVADCGRGLNNDYIAWESTKQYLNFTSLTRIGSTNFYAATATASQSLSKAQYTEASTHINVFITTTNSTAQSFLIQDFQIFRELNDGNGNFIAPADTQVAGHTAQVLTVAPVITHYLFNVDATYSSLDDLDLIATNDLSSYTPIYNTGFPKITSIQIKESNRFNIIQSLCEAFECWASFEIEHNANGTTGEKKVKFHNYIGKDNPLNFSSGINETSITRTVNSEGIISKLLVKDGANEFAPSGYCSIRDAANNPIKDVFILNFDYYINHGMIDAAAFERDLYVVENSSTNDLPGYYIKLGNINKQLLILSERLEQIRVPLGRAQKDVTVYQTGYDSAVDGFDSANQNVIAYCGKDYDYLISMPTTDSIYTRLKNDTNFRKAVEELYYFHQQAEDYAPKLETAKATLNSYLAAIDTIDAQFETLRSAKIELNNAFYQKYGRFVQEGSWVDNSYISSDLYYYDALSTLYESSMPKITYTINVIDVSPLDGYEAYNFDVGDRTYVIDPEFFGYTYVNDIKTPAREQVSITEITNALDDPASNKITVQTYSEFFKDLFQRVNATIQQVQLSTGAYERASALADADVAYKLGFLQDALNDAANVLTNMGDQSVVWDKQGVTITDETNPSQLLRIVSGGILLSDDGGESWQLGLTSKGISANKITSGQIDTSLIQIMNGNEAYFKWDFKGITAYDFQLNTGEDSDKYPYDLNTNKGVRFDRFGIYGYEGVDGATWLPTTVVEYGSDGEPRRDTGVRQYSTFELTNNGLNLNLGRGLYQHAFDTDGRLIPVNIYHHSTASFGKTNDIIYSDWLGDMPYYNPTKSTNDQFVKILSLGLFNDDEDYFEHLAIYDDGTLVAENAYLSGEINASSGAIAGWTINKNELTKNNMHIHAKNGINFNNKFQVDPSGNVTADGDFGANGNIKANGMIEAANFKGNIITPSITVASSSTGTQASLNIGIDFLQPDFSCFHDLRIGNLSSSTAPSQLGFCPEGSSVPDLLLTRINLTSTTPVTYYFTYGNPVAQYDSIHNLTFVDVTVSIPVGHPVVAVGDTVYLNITLNTATQSLKQNVRVPSGDRSFTVHFSAIGFLGDTEDFSITAPSSVRYLRPNDNPYPYLAVNGHICPDPSESGNLDLGAAEIPGGEGGYWEHVYAHNIINGSSPQTSSDRNLKNTISPLISAYSDFFDSLAPVSFKYNNGTSDRLHLGFIAQDVETALSGAGLSNQEFGGLCIDENGQYFLRYEEFVSLNTWEIQKLKQRVAQLEQKILALENEI